MINGLARRAKVIASASIVALLLAVSTAMAGAPAWGPIQKVTDAGQPAAGSSIDTTKASGQRYLHATYRRDAGKVLYSRSKNGGDSWSAPVKLADVGMVFGEPRIAAAGNDIWIAYARRYTDPDTGTPGKAIIVRHNGRHGAASAWDRQIRLSAKDGDVRAPSIAVTDGGDSIDVTYSNLRNDTTRLISSHNGGRTWTATAIGEGFEEDGEGVPFVVPVVAAAGENAVVAWLAAGNVATARVTTDGGDSWSDEVAVGQGLSAAAARAGRLAVAGTREGGIAWVRVWNDGSWGDVQDVPQAMFGAETADSVEVDVVLRSENRIGVVYSAQLDVDEETADTWEEIHWFQSADEGETWGAGQLVSRAGSETAAFDAARPTALWLDSGRLWVAWEQEKFSAPGDDFFAIRERP
jgi:hypothetical protein